jgi:IS30 family transposase
MRIREALRGGALTAGEIAREIGSHKSTVLRYLKRMNDVVQVTPSAPGRGGNEGLWGLRADG